MPTIRAWVWRNGLTSCMNMLLRPRRCSAPVIVDVATFSNTSRVVSSSAINSSRGSELPISSFFEARTITPDLLCPDVGMICLDRVPDTVARRRHVQLPHTQRGKCIENGNHHGRQCADGTSLARAFGAEQISACRRRIALDRNAAHRVG